MSEPTETRSRVEIIEGIRAMSDADWVRLRKTAHRYARPSIGADDLLQEAFSRALDGRLCPRHVDVVRFLAEAMRSIAHGEEEKTGNRLRPVSVDDQLHRSAALAVADTTSNVEDQIIAGEDADSVRAALFALFEDDRTACEIMEGLMEGLSPEEIRVLLDLDARGYATKRRLIRRRIDRHYPEGWTL